MRILITGASSGLGRDLALGYARTGVSLALCGRNADRLEAAAAACRERGAEVEAAVLNVAEAEPTAAWIRDFEAGGPIDILIANAGTSASPQADDVSDGVARASLQVRTNLLGAIHTIEPAIPAMVARGAGQIAVVASTAAYRGIPFMPAYCASKAGVRSYGEALRGLLAPHGVKVSVVVPSFFDSAMTDRFQGAKPMLLPTAAAAALVRRGLDRGEARIVFPRRIGLLMQLYDVLPASMGDAILRANRFRIEDP